MHACVHVAKWLEHWPGNHKVPGLVLCDAQLLLLAETLPSLNGDLVAWYQLGKQMPNCACLTLGLSGSTASFHKTWTVQWISTGVLVHQALTGTLLVNSKVVFHTVCVHVMPSCC